MKTWLQLILCALLGLTATTGGWQSASAAAPFSPQGTIQTLIDNAVEGSIVNIGAGTFNETLTVAKNLTLRGVTLADTILQPAAANQRVITVTGGKTLHLEYLRVTGAALTNGGGGGVYVAESGSLVLDHVQIDHNQATYGGGVFQEGAAGSVTASNCLIDNNTATFTGGGVYAEGNATFSYVMLQNNTAANHGGGLHVNTGTASLTGGSVTANHALYGNGGGVNVNNSLNVAGTLFYNNTAAGTSGATGSGGAITQWNVGATVSISEAVFTGNSAQVSGGAVYIQLSFLSLSNSTFTTNTVDSGATGVDTYGGGVYAGGGLDGSGLTFTSNSAKYLAGHNSSSGGGLYIQRPSTGASSITSSTFDGNFAWYGSAINSGTTVQLTLTSSTFVNNGSLPPGAYSGYGGGVDAYWVHGDKLLFQNNKALNFGGGLDASHIVLTNSRFLNNTASSSGGGIYAYDDFTGTNLLFASNESGSGAAVYVETGPAVLKHITVGRPTRSTSACIFVEATGSLELKNSIISACNIGMKVNGTATEDYNLYFNNLVDYDPTGGGTITYGTHNVAAKDPLFAAPTANDYHLRWPSPAIGLGTSLGVATDLDGRLRLSGRNDVGAYQFWSFVYLPAARK